MSLTELKRSAIELPEQDRRELAAFLLQLSRERNEVWREEISRRMQAMDGGKQVPQADFERRAGLADN